MSEARSSRAVRWAQAVVNGMEVVADVFLSSMETIGAKRKAQHEAGGMDAPRLGFFLKATSRAATGVKWSLIGVVVIGVLAMVGVLAVRTVPAPATNQPSRFAQGAAPQIASVIRLKCAKGAYRDLPEIQASACGKPTTQAGGEAK